MRIFTAAGRPLVSFLWEEPGRLVALGWSDDEVLLCVEEGGNVLPYSVHGELQPNQFSLGTEVRDHHLPAPFLFARLRRAR